MPWQVSYCMVYAESLSQCGRLDCSADFLNGAQLPPFVKLHQVLITKRLHAQFVVVRQLSHWQALASFETV